MLLYFLQEVSQQAPVRHDGSAQTFYLFICLSAGTKIRDKVFVCIGVTFSFMAISSSGSLVVKMSVKNTPAKKHLAGKTIQIIDPIIE